MGTLLAILAAVGPTLVQSLIKLAEAKHAAPQAGPVKKEMVMGIVLPLLDKLFAGTGIPVNQDVISKLIDDFVGDLKKKGELSAGAVAPGVSGSALTISGTLQVQR